MIMHTLYIHIQEQIQGGGRGHSTPERFQGGNVPPLSSSGEERKN